jgi:hypothetical protein
LVNQPTPVPVAGITNAVAVSAGWEHSCALLASGEVRCWGSDSDGQLGDGDGNVESFEPLPVPVVGLTDAEAVSTGDRHTCALRNGGAMVCWGRDARGQLGNDALQEDSSVPVPVAGITNALAISAGANHTCALRSGGTLSCWGFDNSGQLGNGAPFEDRPTPEAVVGISDAVALAAGREHTCTVRSGGAMACWGNDANGQLGNGDAESDNQPVPVGVINLPPAAAASAGEIHACARLSDGFVRCWGSSFYGQVGDGAFTERAEPVAVVASCYTLTLAAEPGGGAPTAAPANSPGCPAGHFLHGAPVVLTGAPDATSRVGGYSLPAVLQDDFLTGLLDMPAQNITITVAYTPCHLLTLTSSGAAGAAPVATPDRSPGCQANRYIEGAVFEVTAAPAQTSRVAGWTGTLNDPEPGQISDFAEMPDGPRTVNVAYEACYLLTRARTGEGAAPTASPASTPFCATDRFVAGAAVSLTAAPAANWRVAGWTGTANDASTAPTNNLVMPAADRSVTVAYETGVYLPMAFAPE